ncbi:MFS transporter [Aquibaculum sediminis]|uniref:MFS transporter n=1 Tax=Aquibaculum sediminis TaxID=3231907 RepID=UPI003453A1D9
MSNDKTTGLLAIERAHLQEPFTAPSHPLEAVVVALLLTSVVAATYGFGTYLFAQLVTDMRADLGFGYTVAGTITAAGQFGFLAFAIGGAWLAPRVGGGQVVIGSVVLCGAALGVLPMTNNILLVGMLLTVLSGTAASAWVPMVEIVARTIRYRHRGKVLGLASSGTSYGVFLNSLLVPIFVPDGGWRGVWYTVGTGTLFVAAIALVVFARLGLFRRQPDESRATGPEIGPDAVPDTGILARVRALAAPWVLLVWAITFFNGFSTLPFQNYLAPYLREELALSVDFAALVWGTIGFVGMFAGFVLGSLSDRTGVRLALLISYGFVFLSAAILVFAPVGHLPVAAGVLFALAFYPIFGLVPAYIAKMAGGRRATAIFGIANVTLGLGGVIGNYLGGIVKDATGTFIWVYVAVAVTGVLLGLLALSLPRESDTAGPIGTNRQAGEDSVLPTQCA